MTETESPAVDIKTEVAKDEAAADAMNDKLIQQVEYYFGDNNLPRDKFIKEECSKNEGWMNIETLLKFNRVKDIVVSVSEDARVAKIAEILKASELVNVDESCTKIRRNPEIPIPDTTSENRTVYLKGFHKTETKLDDLLAFFKSYEGVEAVLMRYYKEKTMETETTGEGDAENGTKKVEPKIVWVRKFKGSIFVVFKTPEQAKKLLEEKDLVYRGTTIAEKMLHTEYRNRKLAEYKERVAARNRKRKGDNASGDKDVKEDGDDVADMEVGKTEKPQDDIVKGALLKVKNIPKGLTREDFKVKWYATTSESDCRIIFADFNKGDTEGVLRLEKAGAASEALKQLPDGKFKVEDDQVIDVEAFTEEEETKYLQEIAKKRLEKKRHFGGGGRGRGGRGRMKRRRY